MSVPPDLVMGLLGSADQNLRALEAGLSAEVHVRGNAVNLSGSAADVALAERVISELIAIVAGGQALSPDSVRRSVALVAGDDGVERDRQGVDVDIAFESDADRLVEGTGGFIAQLSGRQDLQLRFGERCRLERGDV